MPVLTSVKVVQALSLRNGVLLLAFHHEGVVVVALDVIHVVLTQKHLPITAGPKFGLALRAENAERTL